MTADKSFFRFQGGFSSNSLCDILQLNEANENDIQPIIHSPYYDNYGHVEIINRTKQWMF